MIVHIHSYTMRTASLAIALNYRLKRFQKRPCSLVSYKTFLITLFSAETNKMKMNAPSEARIHSECLSICIVGVFIFLA